MLFLIHTGGLGPCPALWGGPPHLLSRWGERMYCLGVWIGSLNGAKCLSQGLSIPAWGPCMQLRRPWEMMCALFWELNLCASLSVWDGHLNGGQCSDPFQKRWLSISFCDFASPALFCNNNQYPRLLYCLGDVLMCSVLEKYLES